VSKAQYHGPLGHRYPMFWCGTYPSAMFGSHIEVARDTRRPGSRYRYDFVSALIWFGAVSSRGA
jgi:hypothetical protein